MKKYILPSAISIAVVLFSFSVGMLITLDYTANSAEPLEQETAESVLVDLPLAKPLTESAETAENDIKITAKTRMVYEYYYLGDGTIETAEEMPPYFLLDMTENAIENTFVDWQIMSFTPDEVVMRKNIEGKSNQYYIIGIHEGYVAVFYTMETNGTNIKEITDTPVTSLAEEEQERLRAGIQIFGDGALFKALEDYGS